ncbi:NUDIX hydrolase [Antribacter sp. KLBMP9083]|uniref:NUDIX hydrolase n=1 Tax=Antribacter soli TaxID=2910976 RepID=A0AA41QGF7_9MICO|nr:NUDIX hydrolase [Antribacter soli]MCF4123003.1 NUDIX hydrolase [Antribacter soli]
MSTDPTARFATPRVAAGALFATHDAVLLVRKTYGNRWDLPGGYLDIGESPAAACEREVHEELGLKRTARRMLVCDWAPNPGEGDKILYLFDCGTLGDDEDRIVLDRTELDHWQWVPIAEIDHFAIPRLARRVREAHTAWREGTTLYLEHGAPR